MHTRQLLSVRCAVLPPRGEDDASRWNARCHSPTSKIVRTAEWPNGGASWSSLARHTPATRTHRAGAAPSAAPRRQRNHRNPASLSANAGALPACPATASASSAPRFWTYGSSPNAMFRCVPSSSSRLNFGTSCTIGPPKQPHSCRVTIWQHLWQQQRALPRLACRVPDVACSRARARRFRRARES